MSEIKIGNTKYTDTMDKIHKEVGGIKCCGKCIYYNGDMGDKEAFCDEREDFVSRKFYCYRYEESDELEGEEE